MKRLIYFVLGCVLSVYGCTSGHHNTTNRTTGKSYIKPYAENARYWEYKGKPVLLLGGSKNDNLFQSQGLKEHLDSLQAIGGNYIRNTMSTRDSGDVWPFYRQPDGKYDLDQWGEEYWKRFENLLKLTSERDIIVQLEIWDRFDYSREPWKTSPWNPGNNINYTSEETGLETEYPEHPSRDLQPFFHSIPGMPRYSGKLDIVRSYQEKYIAKLLSYSLNYGNILYCMDNETSTPPEWGRYWIRHIRHIADKKQVRVYLTDMFDRFFIPQQCPSCLQVIAQPDVYTFMDISQINSRNFNQAHWDTLQWILAQRDKYPLRPVNNTKIYGGMNSTWGSGSNADGVERFCRDIVGGCASARHHRPPHGNGLNGKSRATIQAVRKIETLVKFWDIKPRMDLLSGREPDEAYLTASAGKKYVIYFTGGGSVKLDLRQYPETFILKWININTGEWGNESTVTGGDYREITAPDKGGWFGVIVRLNPDVP
ncbi:MAG: hypothetical protein GXO83_02785 [Chlorobi bacterium]|nr:hypothetical protein [Chlorobiota bacterium]